MNGTSYENDPDVAAMLRFQAGDERAFRDLFRRHYRSVVGFVGRGLRSQARAEDVAQDVFLRLYRFRDNYRPHATFRTFLFHVARNAMLNALRDRTPGPGERDPQEVLADLAGDSNPEQSALKEDLVMRTTMALYELPERQRTAVILTRFQEMSYEEAAAVLEVSEKALKSLLNRARVALAGRVAP
jgi:RNA polymerase sigma-70 factor (ECF subfamily)